MGRGAGLTAWKPGKQALLFLATQGTQILTPQRAVSALGTSPRFLNRTPSGSIVGPSSGGGNSGRKQPEAS